MTRAGITLLLWYIVSLQHVSATAAKPSLHAAAAVQQHKPPTSCAAAADVDPTEPVPPGCHMELVLAPVSDSPITATVPPSSKWAWCGMDGRSDMQYTVMAAVAADQAAAQAAAPVDVYVSVLPGQAAAQHCNALAPSHCRGLYGTTCSGSNCSGAYPGELSGRLKCILVMNAFYRDDVIVTTGVQLQPAGNWSAIIAGVVLASCALLAAMAVGCYSDISSLKTKALTKQRQPQGEPLLQQT